MNKAKKVGKVNTNNNGNNKDKRQLASNISAEEELSVDELKKKND